MSSVLHLSNVDINMSQTASRMPVSESSTHAHSNANASAGYDAATHPVVMTVCNFFMRQWITFNARRFRRQTIRDLSVLDNHLLCDIGLDRSEIAKTADALTADYVDTQLSIRHCRTSVDEAANSASRPEPSRFDRVRYHAHY